MLNFFYQVVYSGSIRQEDGHSDLWLTEIFFDFSANNEEIW